MAAKKAAKRAAKAIPVIACSTTRDVWYGHTTDVDATPLVLHGARHCYRWDVTRGLGQLAETGPGAAAQIGARVGVVRMRSPACVLECSPQASTALEAAAWAR